jgi:plastocyanin
MNKRYLGIGIGAIIAFGILALAFTVILPKNNEKKTATPVAAPTNAPQTDTTSQGPRAQIIIRLTNGGFYPASTTIKPNTRIVWVNDTEDKATVNSDDHPTHAKFKLLNLGEFDKGQAIQTILSESGTYTYHNHLSPEVKGTIIVQ